MQWTYVSLGLIAGIVLPLQAMMNGRLGQHLGGPVWAATVSFFIGTCGLLVYQLVQRAAVPSAAQFSAVPLWLFAGGFLGAVYVASATIVAPRLGATALFSLVIFGQLVASLLLDHFGVLSAESHPVNFLRVLGVVMVFCGAMLALRY